MTLEPLPRRARPGLAGLRPHNGGCGPVGRELLTSWASRANMANIRQPRPDPGLDLQVEALETFEMVSSSLGREMGSGAEQCMKACTAKGS